VRLTHAQFIEKMASRKAAGTWEAWRERHKDDPQIPSLGDETHYMVCALAEYVDMTSQESMRASLIKDFIAESTNGKLNHTKHGVPNSLLIKVMKASGLKWFLLDGCPLIHWSEKA
jgi:hypothetical protein